MPGDNQAGQQQLVGCQPQRVIEVARAVLADRHILSSAAGMDVAAPNVW